MSSATRSLLVSGFVLAAVSTAAQPVGTEVAGPATSRCAIESLKPLPRLNASAQQNVIAAIRQASACLGQRDAVCAEAAITSVQSLTLSDDERALLAIPRAELGMLREDSATAVQIYRDALAGPALGESIRRQITWRLAFVLNTRRDFAEALRALPSSDCASWTADAWGMRAIAYQNVGARSYALENFDAALKLYELEGRAVPAAIHDSHQAVLASETPAEQEGEDIVPIVRANPDYPTRALEQGVKGWVQLEFDVTDLGTVDNVRVVDSTDEVFERNAIAAVQRWRYVPKFEDGLPVRQAGNERSSSSASRRPCSRSAGTFGSRHHRHRTAASLRTDAASAAAI
jgi:TonB family protein